MRTQALTFILICFTLCSCDKFGNTNYSVAGKAQKGPFSKGSVVTLYELEDDLQQTGNSFLSSTTSSDGSFEFDKIPLKSSYALFDVNGFYFSEIYGKMSPAAISLQGIADISDEQAVNINVMMHIIRKRVENLVSDGLSFQEAKMQAESELLIFLGVSETINEEFEAFDISEDAEQNAILLALSMMVQRFVGGMSEQETMPAELTALLSTFSTDFGEDGRVDQSIVDTILYNISHMNLTDLRNNVEDRYDEIGVASSIPDFEKYIAVFQKKYSENIYTSFVYPKMASPEPDGGEIPNLLYLPFTNTEDPAFSMAAIIPLNSSLTVKLILHPDNGNGTFSMGGLNFGWEIVDTHNGITIKSQRENELMSMLVHLEEKGSAIIEYYEDDPETPTYSKTITWGPKDTTTNIINQIPDFGSSIGEKQQILDW